MPRRFLWGPIGLCVSISMAYIQRHDQCNEKREKEREKPYKHTCVYKCQMVLKTISLLRKNVRKQQKLKNETKRTKMMITTQDRQHTKRTKEALKGNEERNKAGKKSAATTATK